MDSDSNRLRSNEVRVAPDQRRADAAGGKPARDSYGERMDNRTSSADLLLDELRPVPWASLRGQLLDNPSVGPAPALTWLLEIPGWPDGNSSVNVTIDWIPLDVPSWRELEGAQVECSEADEPIAAYAYDGCWFQFEYVRIQVLRQVGTVARFDIELDYCDEMFSIELADGQILETDRLCATVDVEFEGIRVEPDTDRQLAEFTDTADLVFDAGSGLYRPVVKRGLS
ncbi:hypothetical protein [Nocardia xishanensis]|uniref:hypothetical protein n=1 Tax=Nocardia xishanensis TaxID=238964 RepID=UPI00342A04CB